LAGIIINEVYFFDLIESSKIADSILILFWYHNQKDINNMDNMGNMGNMGLCGYRTM